MAPTIAAVGTLVPGNDTSGTTQSFTKPSGVVNGSLLVAIYSMEHNGSGTLLAAPTGWTKAPDSDGAFQAVANGTALYVFYKVVTDAGSEPSSYAMPVQTGRWRRGAILRVSGHDTANPWDGGDGAVSASNTSTPNVSVTTTGADRLLLWAAASYNLSSWSTMPSGFTELAAFADASTTANTAASRALATAGAAGGSVATGVTTGKAAWVGAIRPESTTPPVPPGEVFDLANWKWTGPIEDPLDPGDAIEIQQPELDTYSSAYFELDASDDLVFTAPNQGVTTSGSGSTRSELREMEDGVEAAWTPFDAGVRQLTVTERVDPTSLTDRQEMIIGQIHAGAEPAVYIAAEWESSGSPVTPRLRVFKDRNDGSGSSSGVGNMLSGSLASDGSTVFTWRIRVENEQVIVSSAVGGPEGLPTSGTTNRFVFDATDDFGDDTDWYFKAGAYNKGTVAGGGTGSAIATASFIELIQPGGGSTTYDRTGGAAALGAGSGTRTLTPAAVHTRTGGAAALGAGSGAVDVVPPAVHARTGGAAALGAGSGARERTHDRAGGAAALGAGGGARQLVRSFSGGAAAFGAGSGSAEVLSPAVLVRSGGAAALGAGSGSADVQPAAVLDRTGGGAGLGAGSGSVEVDAVTIFDRTGGAAALGAGIGARQLVRSYTGGAAAIGAGSGTRIVTPATVHERTGGAAAIGAGIGSGSVGGAIEYSRTGGAAGLGAGSGAVEVAHPAEHARTGGAAGLAAGSGTRQRTHDRAGGAAGVAGGSGAAEVAPAAVHERAGGAAALGAGAGQLELDLHTVHQRSGGAAGLGAGAGTRAVTHPTVYARSGGGAGVGAGLALVEVIPAAVHVRTGGAAAVGAGAGRGRVGGQFHVGRPYRVGSWHAGEPIAAGRQHAGVPYAAGQHHAGPESVT